MSFTVYKLSQANTLSSKEHLNNWDEVCEFFGNNYDRMPTVVVVQDSTDKAVIYTDDGEWFAKVHSIENFSEKRDGKTLTL